MTRIIGGTARGRRLLVPPTGTRPTSDRVREALFSSLESQLGGLSGVRVLDLYSGSGAIGLEAASRGAAAVTLVENDRSVLTVLRTNVENIGLSGIVVVGQDVGRWADQPCPSPSLAYEAALLDPPYDLAAHDVQLVLASLAVHGWLVDEAVVVVERPRRDPGWAWPDGYAAIRDRTYGDTVLRSALWYRRDGD